MDIQQDASAAAKRGFWVAAAIAFVYLLSAIVNPVMNVLHAAVFAVIAWGIRRGSQWAAAAGVCVLLLSLASSTQSWAASPQPGRMAFAFAISVAFLLLCCYLLVLAVLALHKNGVRSTPWPWYALILVAILCWVCLKPFVIRSSSMEDTLLEGDQILTETAMLRLGADPQRGDVVLIRSPLDSQQVFAKRVVGIPGDRLRIRSKQLFRNGALVNEPYVSYKTDTLMDYRDNFPARPDVALPAPARDMLQNHVRDGEVIVPEGGYFVLGDNRDLSLDSRYWGFITRDKIAGKAIVIYGSYDLDGSLGTAAKVPAIWNLRWSRLFRLL
ncbi:MAG TPA: signal peptidase I [Bryobacteraceae bacterium]|nr:signal peptidase I [Bryobacteraceae bacterium]